MEQQAGPNTPKVLMIKRGYEWAHSKSSDSCCLHGIFDSIITSGPIEDMMSECDCRCRCWFCLILSGPASSAAATDAGADTDAEASTSGPLLPSLPPPLQSY